MTKTILIAGATGDLGGRIIRALLERGADVRALVRPGADRAKVEKLEQSGAQVISVDLSDIQGLTRACEGISCVVSALQGLSDVVVDGQSMLLKAAIASGVPRFIPSDFSSDFTQLAVGDNRNFDLRRTFHERLDQASITSTTIFNGAFSEILAYNIPFLNFKKNTIGYWGDKDWRVDFTSMDNTAAFTAAASLDSTAPRILRIASFQVSANELATLASDVTKTHFEAVSMGSLDELSAYNKRERAAHPEGENEVFPDWQRSQYMHSMFSSQLKPIDNARYQGIKWTTAKEVIAAR